MAIRLEDWKKLKVTSGVGLPCCPEMGVRMAVACRVGCIAEHVVPSPLGAMQRPTCLFLSPFWLLQSRAPLKQARPSRECLPRASQAHAPTRRWCETLQTLPPLSQRWEVPKPDNPLPTALFQVQSKLHWDVLRCLREKKRWRPLALCLSTARSANACYPRRA